MRLGSADIAAILRREIVSGALMLHDRLPSERAMAETHGVSRGTVREALLRLEREGLVEIRAGSGTYIVHTSGLSYDTPIESARPLELMDARFALEPHVCRLAVLHTRRADIEALEALLDKMERCDSDTSLFAETDAEFHSTLVQSTSNNLLIWMVNQVNSVRGHDEWKRMREVTLDPSIIRKYNAQHRRIVEAIKAREPERAAAQMKEHLETARLSLTRAAAA